MSLNPNSCTIGSIDPTMTSLIQAVAAVAANRIATARAIGAFAFASSDAFSCSTLELRNSAE